MNLVIGVLTPPAVFIAVVGGGAFGFVLLTELIQSDRYGTATANAKTFGAVITVLTVAFGLVFYVGQIIASILTGDDQWPRAAARSVLFFLFCLATGIGTWIGLHREWRHR